MNWDALVGVLFLTATPAKVAKLFGFLRVLSELCG